MINKDLAIAWRNLWRNRKRTLITVSAVILAVVLSTFTSSMQEGTYARMIDNMVKFYSGYIQIHHPDYWESKSINDTFEPDSLISSAIRETPEIAMYMPRLESFTLVSSGENTRGCALIGIDPAKEDSITGLSKWIDQGSYLEPGDDGLILAVNLARNLDVQVGDTLILMSQGYHGSSASALIPLKGILKFPSPDLNGFGAYIDINTAGNFFSAEGRITSMVIMVDDYRQVNATKRKLNNLLEPNYSVMTWDEMQPDLVSLIEGDRAGGVVMKGILYMVVGFGILSTVIMMMAERKKEMGVMVAVGMHKFRLLIMLTLESILLGLTGVLIGILFSIPFIWLLVKHPIPIPGEIGASFELFGIEPAFYFSMIPKVFVNQAITIFILTLLIAVYPLMTVHSMKVIKAIYGK